LKSLSLADLKILDDLNKKINYHKTRVKWYEDEKKYFYRKGGYDR